MNNQLHHLDLLLQCLPSSNSCRGFSDLNGVLSKYTKILDCVNAYDARYKQATTIYYKGIALIRDNIEVALYSTSQKEKLTAYECARNKLKTDIDALATLIRPHEQLVEMYV